MKRLQLTAYSLLEVPAVTELAAASEALLRVLLNNFCGHHDNAGVLLAAEQQPSAAVEAGLQQQQQQLLQQQLLPALLLQQQQQSVAATLLSTTKYASSGSSNKYFGHQYQSVRQASSRSRRSTAASTAAAAARKQLFLGSSDQSHSLTDLQHHMAAAGVPEAVAAAILSKANTWPSLSRDPVEIVHRIHKLQDLMGAAAAAHDIIMTHPQVLTRPPAALQQQIYNLVDWLRVPILPQQQWQQQQQLQPDTQVCQDFMDFIRTNPGCLSMSKDYVMRQLAAVQSLLLLPALPELAEDEIRAVEQLLHEAQQQQQQSAEVAWLTKELQRLQDRRQQLADAFNAWHAEQQQQQQQQAVHGWQQHSSSSSSWPWHFVSNAPEWLLIDPVAAMPRRIEYLARTFSQPAGSSSSSLQMKRQITDLLLSAPQLITVSPAHIPAKIKVLAKLLLQHPAVINSHDYAYWMTNPMERLVIPTLQQAPLLLLPTAKLLEQRGAELRSLLPLLPLHHVINLLLLHQQPLQWQQLDYLQHVNILPMQPKIHWQQQQQRMRQGQQQQQQASVIETWNAWGFDEYNAAVNALVSSDNAFTALHPDYVSWRAVNAAVEQSVRDGRESWGWLAEFQNELTGGKFKAWLSEMQGNWHRLLLLSLGKPWTVGSSSSSGGKIRSRSRRSATAASSSSSTAKVALQQISSITLDAFPYRPIADLGPMIFDLPEQQQQQLLLSSSSKSALGQTASQMSAIWQQLVAAAAVQPAWQQQLDQVLDLLPIALAAAGWQVQAAAAAGSSGASSSSRWMDGVVESRCNAPQAAAAAAARYQFWQHVQQPGVLNQLICRLHYLHQLGPEQQQHQQQQHSGSSSSSSSSSTMHDLWPALVSDHNAFTSAHPDFDMYMQLRTVTEDKAAWSSELDAMHGHDLLLLLQQAAAHWSRIEFLTADSSSSSSGGSDHGGLWQAISLHDTITSSEDHFLEMFPDYKYGSWKALAAMRQTNTAAAAGSSDHDDRRITISQDPADPAAAAAPSSVIKSQNVDLAAQRLQLLQQYAAMHPAWLAELSSWSEAWWSSATQMFTPMRARRLEFILQLAGVQGGDTVGSSRSPSGAPGEVPSLRSVVLSANSWFHGKYPAFKPWLEIGQIVKAIPRWAAAWQSLKGQQLQDTMNSVMNMTAADLKSIYQQAYDAHIAELRASSSSSSSKVPRELAVLQVGVTGCSSSSSSRHSSSEAAAAGSTMQQQTPANSSTAAAAATQQQQLAGLDLVLHRLRHFSRFRANAAVLHSLSLTDVLTQPQDQIADRYKGLDPDLTAARNQGLADAESRVLEESYPWLGPKAVKPEVLEGLSPAAKRVLAKRPNDLLLLQQVAHTWPAWEQQLHDVSSAGLSRLLENMNSRSERLQVIVRAGLQRYNSLRSILLMDEQTWRARYPIAQQLAELQAAAEGVSAWERTLSHLPSGRELLGSIDRLHTRRGRLVFLKDEGLVEGGGTNVLKVLQMSEERFMTQYPDYPGDEDMALQLTAEE